MSVARYSRSRVGAPYKRVEFQIALPTAPGLTNEVVVTATDLKSLGWTRVTAVDVYAGSSVESSELRTKGRLDLYLRNGTEVTGIRGVTGQLNTQGGIFSQRKVLDLAGVEQRLSEFPGTPPVGDDWLLKYRNTEAVGFAGLDGFWDLLVIFGV